MLKYLLSLIMINHTLFALEWTEDLRNSVNPHKETLADIRRTIYHDLFEAPEDKQRDIKSIAHNCTTQMTNLFLSVVDLFQNDLHFQHNNQSRRVAIALLGSGATHFMTPFSDIEFIIFVDRITGKEDPFKKQLLHFCQKIADYMEALGESGFLDGTGASSPVHGFRLDEHNIPPYTHAYGKLIGYGTNTKKIKNFGEMLFINTPVFLHNALNVGQDQVRTWFNGDKQAICEYNKKISSFSQVLRTIRHVYGDESLTRDFKYLFTMEQMKQASLNSVSYNIETATKNPHFFPFLFSQMTAFPLQLDLKKQMLRIPEQFIIGLGVHYKIRPGNVLDVIESLKTIPNLPESLSENTLKQLEVFFRVTYLVLCDISYHDKSQCKGPQDLETLNKKWDNLRTQETLFEIREIMSPVFHSLLMSALDMIGDTPETTTKRI